MRYSYAMREEISRSNHASFFHDVTPMDTLIGITDELPSTRESQFNKIAHNFWKGK